MIVLFQGNILLQNIMYNIYNMLLSKLISELLGFRAVFERIWWWGMDLKDPGLGPFTAGQPTHLELLF